MHRLHVVEEQCCDAWVTWALPRAEKRYADALIATAEFLSNDARPLPAAASGLGPLLHLERRITMLFRGTKSRRLGLGARIGVLSTALLVLPILPTVGQEEPVREASSSELSPDEETALQAKIAAVKTEYAAAVAAAAEAQDETRAAGSLRRRALAAEDALKVAEQELAHVRAGAQQAESRRAELNRTLDALKTAIGCLEAAGKRDAAETLMRHSQRLVQESALLVEAGHRATVLDADLEARVRHVLEARAAARDSHARESALHAAEAERLRALGYVSAADAEAGECATPEEGAEATTQERLDRLEQKMEMLLRAFEKMAWDRGETPTGRRDLSRTR